MTYADRTDMDQVCLQLACTYCGAEAGHWCITVSGNCAQSLHASRESSYRTGWSVGYQQCEADFRKRICRLAPEELLAYQQRLLAGRRW